MCGVEVGGYTIPRENEALGYDTQSDIGPYVLLVGIQSDTHKTSGIIPWLSSKRIRYLQVN